MKIIQFSLFLGWSKKIFIIIYISETLISIVQTGIGNMI